MNATHEVTNQSTPFENVDLFGANRPLQDALRHLAPSLPTGRLAALGAEAGSAPMQAHARLAHPRPPTLRRQQVSPAPVFEAFCSSRLDGTADVFGLLPAGSDVDALITRALPKETACTTT